MMRNRQEEKEDDRFSPKRVTDLLFNYRID